MARYKHDCTGTVSFSDDGKDIFVLTSDGQVKSFDSTYFSESQMEHLMDYAAAGSRVAFYSSPVKDKNGEFLHNEWTFAAKKEREASKSKKKASRSGR